jgi:hypothetical protein
MSIVWAEDVAVMLYETLYWNDDNPHQIMMKHLRSVGFSACPWTLRWKCIPTNADNLLHDCNDVSF